MSDRDPIMDEVIRRNTPGEAGDVILSRNGRDAYVVMGRGQVRKLRPEIAALHHARKVELLAKSKEQYEAKMKAEVREAARIHNLPWNRARRWFLQTWASFRAGCVDYFFDKPAEAPSPIVHDPSRLIPDRTLRQRERRKARANASTA